jgi:hypothetical protein
MVVVTDKLQHVIPSLVSGVIFLAIDAFDLERTIGQLHRCVAPAVALPAHGGHAYRTDQSYLCNHVLHTGCPDLSDGSSPERADELAMPYAIPRVWALAPFVHPAPNRRSFC